MLDQITDANALLGRYQNEVAVATTRAIVAEALLAEERKRSASSADELANLRDEVEHLKDALEVADAPENVRELQAAESREQ